jgi:hypothetical protein
VVDDPAALAVSAASVASERDPRLLPFLRTIDLASVATRGLRRAD